VWTSLPSIMCWESPMRHSSIAGVRFGQFVTAPVQTSLQLVGKRSHQLAIRLGFSTRSIVDCAASRTTLPPSGTKPQDARLTFWARAQGTDRPGRDAERVSPLEAHVPPAFLPVRAGYAWPNQLELAQPPPRR